MNTAPASPVPAPDDRASGRIWVDPEDPALLRMAGDVDSGAVSAFARLLGVDGAIRRTFAKRLRAVRTVDMREVTFADSSAIGLVASLTPACDRAGRRLVVRGASSTVRMPFTLTGVASLVEFE